MTQTRQFKSPSIIYSAVAAYVVVFFALSVMQHASFHTSYDMAGAMQGLWALALGKSQFNTLWGGHNWVNHAYVISLPVALVYRFALSAYLLFLLQTVALALGAPVVYRLALEKTRDAPVALVFALCYLGYPVLHFSNLIEFHWDAFAPLFLLLTFYYADKALPRLLLCAALTLACKEDMALTLFPMGIYVALRHRRWNGIAVCALSAVWLFVVMGAVVPLLSGGRSSPHLAYWAAYGDTPSQIVRFLLTHPLQTLRVLLIEHDGLKHIFKVNLFLLFLPLLAPDVLLIALPFFLLRFLSTVELHHTIYFQYSFSEIPVIFYAAVIGAQRLLQSQGHRAHDIHPSSLIPHPSSSLSFRAALLLCLVTTSALFGPFRPRGRYNWKVIATRFAFNERSRVLREICRQIPPTEAVSASPWVVSHLAHRRFVYMFPNPYQRAYWNGRPGDPDYGKFTVSAEPQAHLERGREVEWVVIDKVYPAPVGIPNWQEKALTGLRQSGEFEVVRDDRFVLVLRRSRPPQP